MYNILRYEKLTSTNKFALENIDEFVSGTVIRADIQESGRGRFSRKWVSDKKNNCYISFILKPDMKYKNNFPNLTQYLSVILCRELLKYSVKPSIKWPNDVQVNSKKIAGILSEASYDDVKLKGIVLGIGVNLNLSDLDLKTIDIPATALNIECGRIVDADGFINDFVKSFYDNYDAFLEYGFEYIRSEYISYANFIGKEIKIKNPELQNAGIALNVCNDGTLEILTDKGDIKKIISGDVIF